MATSVEIPDKMNEEIKSRIEDGMYSSKAEVIRTALREFLEVEGELSEKEQAVVKLLKEGRIDLKPLSESTQDSIEKSLDDNS